MVHRGPFAGYLTTGLGAAAATVGGHVLGAGEALNEDTPEGASLLGHELVHASIPIQRATAAELEDTDEREDDEERQAEAMEALVAEVVDDLETEGEAEAPETVPLAVNTTALADRVYERIVEQLRRERERGLW